MGSDQQNSVVPEPKTENIILVTKAIRPIISFFGSSLIVILSVYWFCWWVFVISGLNFLPFMIVLFSIQFL